MRTGERHTACIIWDEQRVEGDMMRGEARLVVAMLVAVGLLAGGGEGLATKVPRPAAKDPIGEFKVVLKEAPRRLREFVGRQVERIGAMKDAPSGGWSAGETANLWREKRRQNPRSGHSIETFRSALLAPRGDILEPRPHASTRTTARDGQTYDRALIETVRGMTEIRKHGFSVGARNKSLLARGFKPGEHVTRTRELQDGKVINDRVVSDGYYGSGPNIGLPTEKSARPRSRDL